jgi:hypothetical protein
VTHATTVTVRGRTVALWRIDPSSSPAPHPNEPISFGPDAQASWRAAGLALPRSVPVLWRSVHHAARDLPRATFLDSHQSAPGFEERDRVLDGPSFGLTFFLLLTSVVLDVPLPDDFVASAQVDERGRIGPVEAIAEKIGGIVARAPTIRRILVAADQQDEAIVAARGALDVIGVADAADALRHIFADRLSRSLADAGTDPNRRAELVAAFFRLALVGRGASVDWSPIERGAALALGEWPLDDDQRYRLQFACAVAARHERNAGVLSIPSAAWLDAQPVTLRLALLTHLVQQSADAGVPSAVDTEALALQALPHRVEDRLLPHLKLAGALARLWAVTGREREALDTQRTLAHAFADAYVDYESSYPLAEWYRLSGILLDSEAFEAARDFHARVLTAGGFGFHGGPYVDLSLARAQVMLGRIGAATVGCLEALSHDRSVPAHVRWSATRWLVRALRSQDDRAASDSVLRELSRASSADGLPQRYFALASVDRSILESSRAEAATLVQRLRECDPGTVDHLLRVSADPAFVASRYPY